MVPFVFGTILTEAVLMGIGTPTFKLSTGFGTIDVLIGGIFWTESSACLILADERSALRAAAVADATRRVMVGRVRISRKGVSSRSGALRFFPCATLDGSPSDRSSSSSGSMSSKRSLSAFI